MSILSAPRRRHSSLRPSSRLLSYRCCYCRCRCRFRDSCISARSRASKAMRSTRCSNLSARLPVCFSCAGRQAESIRIQFTCPSLQCAAIVVGGPQPAPCEYHPQIDDSYSGSGGVRIVFELTSRVVVSLVPLSAAGQACRCYYYYYARNSAALQDAPPCLRAT